MITNHCHPFDEQLAKHTAALDAAMLTYNVARSSRADDDTLALCLIDVQRKVLNVNETLFDINTHVAKLLKDL